MARDLKRIRWLFLMLAVYFGILAYLTILRYDTFQTHAFDLGIFNQAFSSALKGKLFLETPDQGKIPSGSFLGVHFNLLIFLLLPVYALYPAPQTLLLLQTAFVVLGAVPVYLVARRITGDERLALVMSLIFLVNPATINLNLYDFHLEAFLPFFLGMFFYFYLASNWRGYVISLVFSLIAIDFAAIVVVAICLAHFSRTFSIGRRNAHFCFHIERFRAKILLATIAISLVAFYVFIHLSGIFSGRTISVQGILSGFINPALDSQALFFRSEFWLLSLIGLMFLPLLVPSQLVMVAPWFIVTMLEGDYATSSSFGYQYAGAFVFPFLLLGSIFAIEKLRKRHLKVYGFVFMIILFSLVASPFNPLTHDRLSGISYQQGFQPVTAHDRILEAALGFIPTNASVLTQNDLFPQVSSRPNAYLYVTDNRTSIQYVLADAKSASYVVTVYGSQSIKTWLPYFMASGQYGILVNDDGVILLKANYSGPVLLAGSTNFVFDYRTLALDTGSMVSDATSVSQTVLLHSASDPVGVTFWFGPYVSLPPGKYNATFVMKTSSATNGSLQLQVDTFLDANTIPVLAQQNLTQASFPHPGSWTRFSLTFDYTPQEAAVGELEFRGVSVFGGPFSLDYVTLTFVSPYSS